MVLTAFALAAALPPTPVPASSVAIAPQHIRDGGMIADLYRPVRTGRAPAILLLGRSEGGLGKAAAAQAAALAARGYAVLQLSYFGGPSQPAALKSIPIETFARALDSLKAQPGCGRWARSPRPTISASLRGRS